jgi:hypothetical protein
MVIVPELLRPIEAGFTLFGFHFPQMFGLSKLILSGFLVILIIFRRQGIMGYNEIIVESIFDLRTYKAALDPRQYAELFKLISVKLRSIGRRRNPENNSEKTP